MNNKIEKVIQEQELGDAAGRFAAATPLPGSAFNALAKHPPVKIGQYEVREFCDADFETLQSLDNPLWELMAVALQAGDVASKDTDAEKIINLLKRGKHAWNVAFVFTRSAEEIDEILEKRGVAGLATDARKEFGIKGNIQVTIKIVSIAIDLMNKSVSTRIDFEPVQETKSNGEVASPAENPC